MTTQELYDHITKHMTPEQALMKLLEGHQITYENLKFKEGEEIHPVMVVAMAALDMGWSLAIPDGKDNDIVRGMAIGTQEYLDEIFVTDTSDNCDKCEGNCDCDRNE